MTTPSQAREALDSDLDAIAAAAARHLDVGAVALDDDGDPVGVTYRDSGTRCYYAADLDDCRDLLERIAAGGADAYSLWCAGTCAQEHTTREGAEGDL